MNVKYIVFVATMAAMLLGATAAATAADNVFASKKKYEKSQALSQANACGDDALPMNVQCSNTGSQIQGKKNSVADASVQVGGEDSFKKKNW